MKVYTSGKYLLHVPICYTICLLFTVGFLVKQQFFMIILKKMFMLRLAMVLQKRSIITITINMDILWIFI